MKGKGTGEGNKAPEDDTKETAFTPEKSKSALTAGKILLQMKSRGMSEAGKVKTDYVQAVKEVKQGVSEAILREQVPPAYHDSIKEYFDTMQEAKDDGKQEEKSE
jgi:hypothetical protein